MTSILNVDLSDLALVDQLAPIEVFKGLVDYGLFGEKVPPCFGSVGLSNHIPVSLRAVLSEAKENKLKKALDKHSREYIRYQAQRDINIPRHMGIPYPASHIIQALAIEKHWHSIQKHCDLPEPQISRIHVRHVGGGKIFEMNYKGSERFDLEERELTWASGSKFLVKADISSCFPSIYTHSIPWALHTREEGKLKRKLTQLPGNLLDKCTQLTRDDQTNGINIGPHSSNIISEIILTAVDKILLGKGYTKLKRNIDDYEFYAGTYDEAENFIRVLGLALREYELSLNEKKTRILKLPRPNVENWVRQLNLFPFADDSEIRFGSVRSFLDHALELAKDSGTSAPINYALQMVPTNLNGRAKRLFVQEAINLALFYPYLAPLLGEHVLSKHEHGEMSPVIGDFCNQLFQIGIQKLYPDAIAHALYYALKYRKRISISPLNLNAVLELDDCISMVLLLEYAKFFRLKRAKSVVENRAALLKGDDRRAQDRQWLLLFHTWSESDLHGNGHSFLGHLKSRNYSFFSTP